MNRFLFVTLTMCSVNAAAQKIDLDKVTNRERSVGLYKSINLESLYIHSKPTETIATKGYYRKDSTHMRLHTRKLLTKRRKLWETFF